MNREPKRQVLAIDFGASSGRAMIGTYEDGKIHMEEIHRFSNDPVIVGKTMYWDVLRLFYEIKQSILKAKQYGKIESIAVDTWGVDFALLDKKGYLLENPVHYRDARTNGILASAFALMDAQSLYKATGNQIMEINTGFQLLALKQQRPEMLERADKLLLMPDLFDYLLSGSKCAETSIASTTQLFNQEKKQWAGEVIESFGLNKDMFPEIVPSGTVVGELSPEICEELGVEPIKVIAVCGHDTQSALVATPAKEEDFIFLSCGTWSLMGTELLTPVIDENSQKLNITNESGYDNRTSFLKNIIGLWMIQESRRQWMREGKQFNFGELETMARTATPFQCFVDPDDPMFAPAGNVPKRIREYCEHTGQYVPQTEAEIVRCIDESLAMKYRYEKEEIEYCTGKKYDVIYLVGGGAQSRLLCEMAAKACHCSVSAGPVEATVLGNIAVQLIALGELSSLNEAREVVKQSQDVEMYEAEYSKDWDKAYERFLKVTGCGEKNE